MGKDATLTLHRELAGQWFHIPAYAPVPAAVVEVPGLEGAELLRQAVRKRHHDFCRGSIAHLLARNRELWAAHDAGVPVRELAQRF